MWPNRKTYIFLAVESNNLVVEIVETVGGDASGSPRDVYGFTLRIVEDFELV